MQRGGIANRNVGKIGGVDLDDSQIGKGIGTDDFRCQNATVAEGHFDFGCAIDHVIVGDDVAVRRDDDAAADAMLDAGLRLHSLSAELLAEETLHLVGNAFGSRLRLGA